MKKNSKHQIVAITIFVIFFGFVFSASAQTQVTAPQRIVTATPSVVGGQFITQELFAGATFSAVTNLPFSTIMQYAFKQYAEDSLDTTVSKKLRNCDCSLGDVEFDTYFYNASWEDTRVVMLIGTKEDFANSTATTLIDYTMKSGQYLPIYEMIPHSAYTEFSGMVQKSLAGENFNVQLYFLSKAPIRMKTVPMTIETELLTD